MTAPEWSLIQYVTEGSEPRVGLMSEGRISAAPEGFPERMTDLLDAWDTWEPRLRGLSVDGSAEVEGARLVAPITFPRKVICSGANYYDHAAEMGTARPDPHARPFFFLKAPTTTVVGPYDDIPFPLDEQAKTDWEIELTLVIGRRGKNIDPADAMSYVAGYTVANDLSARGLFARPDAVFPPFGFDWLAHKSLDGSCPIGPGIVPSWLVEDPQSLALTLTVNGEVKQDSNTSGLVISLADLVAGASRLVTLEPGDLILTGTPAGVGLPRGERLRDGDVVNATIAGIGSIENRMVAA
jgi:2-keto-4-pentenoate hydratase/2-oxohepta-3-ene-1,7-dioic acid hydratase in catechol pathway